MRAGPLVVGGHLSGLAVRRIALEILQNPSTDIDQPADDHSYLATSVTDRLDKLEPRVVDQLTALNKSRGEVPQLSYIRALAALAGLITGAIFLDRTADAIFGSPTSAGWVVLGLLVAVIATSLGFLIFDISRLASALMEVVSKRRDLEGAAARAIRDMLTEAVNERWDTDKQWGTLFDPSRAPSIAGLDADITVASRTYQEISAFIRDHETTAIGIAGRRGIGKTTTMQRLLRNIGASAESVGTHIAAPRRYDGSAVIRLIHRKIAMQVASTDKWLRLPARFRGRNTALRRLIGIPVFVGLALLVTALWVQDNETGIGDTRIQISSVAAFLLIAGGALAGIALHVFWRLLFAADPPWTLSTSVRELARRELEYLNYSAAVESRNSIGWQLGVITGSGEDQVSLTERQLTDAEHVEALKSFLRRLRVHGKTMILVCIDELDKMNSPDDVVAMINGIKDLFHENGLHIVVSLSTDAMHSFAARGVLVRDVFDSAFDTVIEMERMSFEQTCDVMWRRAAGFPMPAVLFCHAWSGGHPRDMLRTARACVAKRVDADQKAMRERKPLEVPELAKIVDAVLLDDVCALLGAAIGKATNERLLAGRDGETAVPIPTLDDVGELVALQQLLREGTGRLYERIDNLDANVRLPRTDDLRESSAMVRVLRPYLRLAAQISRLFAEPFGPAEWRSLSKGDLPGILTDAQEALSHHPDVAARAVERSEQALTAVLAAKHGGGAVGGDAL